MKFSWTFTENQFSVCFNRLRGMRGFLAFQIKWNQLSWLFLYFLFFGCVTINIRSDIRTRSTSAVLLCVLFEVDDWSCDYVTDIHRSWKLLVCDASAVESELFTSEAPGVFTAEQKHKRRKTCCSVYWKKCQGRSEALCLLEITLCELWPEGFCAAITCCAVRVLNALMVSDRHSFALLRF